VGGVKLKWFEAFRQKPICKDESDVQSTQKECNDGLQSTLPAKSQADELFQHVALLTPREYDLFLLLLEGYKLKESAKQLSVKYSTANTHMTAIYKKLNVNSRAELIIRYRDAAKQINEPPK
jgi:DNA-binding CsgD family transcriptional regulator